MKRILIMTCIALIASMAGSAQANMTILLKDMGGYQSATVNGTEAVGIFQPGETFTTFCLETNEYYYPNKTYNVTLSTIALTNNYNPSKGYDANLGGDPLDARTAFLYTNYMNGNTWGYSEQDFQQAIHYIEQETTTSNGLVTIADNAIANGDWLAGDLGNVRVMNVYYLDGTRAQDQLAIVPVPGAILLAGMGIGLVGWIRKKKTI